ncbi:MAG: hypothetical protein Q4C96_05385 [Planctomycetia bacterium]|nr:hypothetical protein [Planctomycetia bacterium]
MKNLIFCLSLCGVFLACAAPVMADDDRDFAGVAQVKVVYADVTGGDPTIVVEFLTAESFHRENEAGDAKHMVGKKYLLMPDDNRNWREVEKYLTTLKVGEVISVAVEQENDKILEVKQVPGK